MPSCITLLLPDSIFPLGFFLLLIAGHNNQQKREEERERDGFSGVAFLSRKATAAIVQSADISEKLI